jgi:hypothetical protein
MTTLNWQELYKAALLELRPEELSLAIETAEAAIHQRLRELGPTWDGASGEYHAIADAMRSLRTLAKTECPPPKTFAGHATTLREVAS